MTSLKSLAIILLNYNGSSDTIECIESLDNTITNFDYDIYIIDNASRKEETDILKRYISSREDFSIYSDDIFERNKVKGNLLILSNDNAGFAGGNNKVIRTIYEDYAYILLLNNDTVVQPDFIEKMICLLNEDLTIGYASCRINNYYDHTLLWNCGGKLRPWGLRKYYSEKELKKMPDIIDAEFITGCALFIRSSVIKKYGTLSDDFFHGEEDFNFCWRMKKNHVKSNRISFSQSLAYIAIYIYIWTVLESTVFTRIPQAYPQYELHIFWSWKAFFVYHDNEMLKENILNCILLMPYGCLLPVALDKRINWKRGLVIGMGTSFVIELLQLITCRGLFEFDDIIHNGFGCMMGAVLGSWCWLRMLKKFKMPRKPHAS